MNVELTLQEMKALMAAGEGQKLSSKQQKHYASAFKKLMEASHQAEADVDQFINAMHSRDTLGMGDQGW